MLSQRRTEGHSLEGRAFGAVSAHVVVAWVGGSVGAVSRVLRTEIVDMCPGRPGCVGVAG